MDKKQGLKVGLVNVVLDGDYQYEQELPLGLACIGAFLRKHGYTVIFKQCFASRGEKELDSLTELKADVYGFQLNMVNYEKVRLVVDKIKSAKNDALTVFGGPFLTSLSEEILSNEPLFDFIILGEGELTILELLKELEKGKKEFSFVNGLAWRNTEGKIVINAPRSLINDLDTLPFPARDFFESIPRDPRDNSMFDCVRVVSSRGCIGKCSFCCVNLYNKVQPGKQWRGRSAQNVVDELEYLSKTFGAKIFNFSDSSFEDPGRLGKLRSREICEGIIDRQLPLSIKIYMRCETMKTEEDIELLKLYKRAGIDVVIIGAEAGSEYELKLYEKNAAIEDNYRAAQNLRKLDIFYLLVGFIMFGPNSTLKTLRENIEYLQKNALTDNLMQVANVMMLIKDSKLYHLLKEEGRVIDPVHYCELPKYKFIDPIAEQAAKHWQNVFVRFPDTLEVNKLQVNLGNLVSRMTNPMNEKILLALKDDFIELKAKEKELCIKFGNLQYEYFIYVLDLLEENCSDEKLELCAKEFFGDIYKQYRLTYSDLFKNFLDKVVALGFSLSGLVFRHYHSAMAIDGSERI